MPSGEVMSKPRVFSWATEICKANFNAYFGFLTSGQLWLRNESVLPNVVQRQRSTGFQPVGLAGVSPASRDPAGRMPAGPTAKMAVLQNFRVI